MDMSILKREQDLDSAYLDGQEACCSGILKLSCPYNDIHLRNAWFDGWEDFNTKERIPWENS